MIDEIRASKKKRSTYIDWNGGSFEFLALTEYYSPIRIIFLVLVFKTSILFSIPVQDCDERMTKIGNILEKNNIAMYISCVFISLIKIIHTEKIGWHLKMSLNFDIIFLFVDLSLKDKRNHKFISDFWFLTNLNAWTQIQILNRL